MERLKMPVQAMKYEDIVVTMFAGQHEEKPVSSIPPCPFARFATKLEHEFIFVPRSW